MLVTGHQPNYLPYPGFFDKISRADLYVIVDNTQFVKRGPFGWIHRNRIRTEDGWMWLTVPCITSGRFHQNINEVEIATEEQWQRKHRRSLAWNYEDAPYFEKYWPDLKTVYGTSWEKLQPLNETVLEHLFEFLGIDVPVRRASDLGVEGDGTEYVLDLCRKTDADTYLSGVHGKDYLDVDRFGEEGVELRFQDYSFPVYDQVFNEQFVPNLSVIDLLFNHGPDSLAILRGEKTVRDRESVTIADEDS